MKRYTVEVIEHVAYTLEVDAEDEEQAKKQAIADVINSADPEAEFSFIGVLDRKASIV